MPPGVVDCPYLCISHPVLYLGEGLFDRIEVRRIGRQEPEPCTCGFDRMTDCCRFVAAKIVHDDDVAWLEDRNQLLFDIGAKALAVDRSVEDTRCCQPIFPQRPEECQGAPVTVWRECSQTFAFRSPPLMGVMLVLIQVSSMKTSRSGSR